MVDPKTHVLLVVTINPIKEEYGDTFNSLAFADKIKLQNPAVDEESDKPFIYKPKTHPYFNPDIARLDTNNDSESQNLQRKSSSLSFQLKRERQKI